ncbi:hypothetical protein [Negadavirga shengliensis]|uniref:Uncharacterized protein n=1 Tax=Negadavirga shengliensis TaxID=1389218 RepID=A0ABV9T2T8_9BACT
MRRALVSIMILLFSFFSFAKEKKEKTFLIIFHSEELKQYNSSAAHVELSFLDSFETRSYSGNSETALLITVPFIDWSICEMGNALVIVGDDRLVPLSEVAFRIIDLEESQENFRALLSSTEDQKSKKRVSNTIRLSL